MLYFLISTKAQQIVKFINRMPIKEVLIIMGIAFIFLSLKSTSENKGAYKETEKFILGIVGITFIVVGIKLMFFF